ncbi:MAG: hypothetical protein AAF708_20715, partial [Deinococcota bacterium]
MKKLFFLLVSITLCFGYAQDIAPVTDEASLVVLTVTEDTRVIQHLGGETEIPTNPQRIVTLQDQNALLPLLLLGAGDLVAGSVGALQENGS